MRYLISDIHGCYEEYRELLDKINFSKDDELYILGDSMDRGPDPIKVIQDLIPRPNTTYIIGNHDYLMYYFMKKIIVKTSGEILLDYLLEDDLLDFTSWVQDGGEITLRQFIALSQSEQQAILKYLADASMYKVIEDRGKKYILTHAGIDNFSGGKNLNEYNCFDFIYARPDYTKRYYQDKNIYVVSGHTPTPLIRKDRFPIVYQGNGHIAIDCGCVFGGQLVAYCIETGEISYVNRREI